MKRQCLIIILITITFKYTWSEPLEEPTTDDYAELDKIAENSSFNCSLREKFKYQPVHDENSYLLKCCPIGQSLNYAFGTGNEKVCHSNNKDNMSNVNPIHAIIYDNCIEDTEVKVSLEIKVGNPCNASILFDNVEDTFYVLQDGTLLLMDKFANESFSIVKQYCLDTDDYGVVYAIVCLTPAKENHLDIQKFFSIFIRLITILCLLLAVYCHIVIEDFRSTGGMCIIVFCTLSAMEFFISITATFMNFNLNVIYFIQKLIMILQLCWFSCLCAETLVNMMKSVYSTRILNISFVFNKWILSIYCILSFIVASIALIFGNNNILYITEQNVTPEQHEFTYIIQNQMWGLALSLALTCIAFLVGSYMKIKLIEKQKINHNSYDLESFDKIKSEAICASLLLLLLTISWVVNILSFHYCEQRKLLTIVETFNDFRGLLILVILMIVHQKWIFVSRWWNDRGFYFLEKTECSLISN